MLRKLLTHCLIDISEMVMPLERLINALRLRTCPRKVTKTVTNDSSILLAIAAATSDAVAGVIRELFVIPWPNRGLAMATPSQRPESKVE